jgi:hypothetical protein
LNKAVSDRIIKRYSFSNRSDLSKKYWTDLIRTQLGRGFERWINNPPRYQCHVYFERPNGYIGAYLSNSYREPVNDFDYDFFN